MLFKAFAVQVFFGLILLFAPITVFLIVYVLQIPNGSYYTIKCIYVGLYYGLFETFSMTYFISSYKNYVKSIFSFARCQKTKAVVHSVVSRSSLK